MKNIKIVDKTIGIYIITNIKNNKIYVGSTKNFERRFYYHINYLKNNKHSNQHLQYAFNLDGEKSFVYSLLEKCEDENLVEREEYYINLLNACDAKFGYNINSKGDRPPSWLGKHHKEETKEKIRNANIGKVCSDYVKEIASKTHKGKKLSDEQIIFLKEKFKGDKNPMFGKKPYDIWLEKYGKDDADKKLEEWKSKVTYKGDKNPMFGKKPYDIWLEKYGKEIADEKLKNWKEKISYANKNRSNKLSEETKGKISKSKIGKMASEETKKLMSEQRKGENNPACKIKNFEVIEILNMIVNGEKIINIAKKYNVSKVTINNIKKGKRKI